MSTEPRVLSSDIERERWFVEKVRPHEGALRGYLRSNFPSVDTDDIVQETYWKILKARPSQAVCSAKAYFFAIARNTAITLIHRGKVFTDTPVSALPTWRVLDGGPDPADVVNADQRYELMSEALSRLPARCRDVLRLAALRGLSNAEISRELGMAENTVRVHLARGIKKCADYVRQMEGTR